MAILDSFLFVTKTIDDNLTYKEKKYVDKNCILYKSLVSGEDLEEIVSKSNRQSESEYKKMMRELVTISPSVINSATIPFSKTFSSSSVVKTITLTEKGNGNNSINQKYTDNVNNFYGRKSIDKYIEEFLPTINKIDPNAYFAIHYDDPLNIHPYPIIIYSDSVINKRFENNILINLLSQNDDTYTCYGQNENIILKKVDKSGVSLDTYTHRNNEILTEQDVLNYKHFKSSNGSVYEIFYQVHELQDIPVYNAGYILDEKTNFKTYLPIWNNGKAYIIKLLKRDYELELSYDHHCFPQKVMATDKCPGSVNDKMIHLGCNNGKTLVGGVCGACEGSGVKKEIKSADETMYVLNADYRKGENEIDITKIIHYVKPEITTITKLEEAEKTLLSNVYSAIFNSQADVSNTVNGVKSAVEISINHDNIYDTLHPFTQHTGNLWEFFNRIVAELSDVSEKITLFFRADRDLKFKNTTEYIQELKLLNESNAPTFVKIDVNKKIAEVMYKGDSHGLKKVLTKIKFTPFSGKSEVHILHSLNSPFVSEDVKYLYHNIDLIFNEFDDAFYDLAEDKQRAAIGKAVTDGMTALSNETPKASEIDLEL